MSLVTTPTSQLATVQPRATANVAVSCVLSDATDSRGDAPAVSPTFAGMNH